MSKAHIAHGATEPIGVIIIDNSRNLLPGLSNIKMRVRRLSDDYHLDWSDSTFKATPNQLLMPLVEVDAAYSQGEYHLDTAPHVDGFNTSAIANALSADSYFLTVVQDGAPQTAGNLPFHGEIETGGWVEKIDEPISDQATPDEVRSLIREFGLDHLVSVNPGIVPAASGTYIRQIMDKLNTLEGTSAYYVYQNWAYSPSQDVLTGQIWIESNNLILDTPTATSVAWYNVDGSVMFTVDDSSPDAQGFFKVQKSAPGLEANKAYYAIATVTVPSVGDLKGGKGTFTIG